MPDTEREARLQKALEEIRDAAALGIRGGQILRPEWIIKRVERALETKGGG